MRVIAGALGGRRLSAPSGRDTRPTSDRVREALFSSLGPAVVGAVVLDLYAGSGALGIEALSRGADRAVFVEQATQPSRVIRRNVAALGIAERCSLHRMNAQDFCRNPVGGPFDVVFIDPPYGQPLAEVHACLEQLAVTGGLSAHADVVIERARQDPDVFRGAAPAQAWLAPRKTRSYGDTVLLYLRAPRQEHV